MRPILKPLSEIKNFYSLIIFVQNFESPDFFYLFFFLNKCTDYLKARRGVYYFRILFKSSWYFLFNEQFVVHKDHAIIYSVIVFLNNKLRQESRRVVDSFQFLNFWIYINTWVFIFMYLYCAIIWPLL